MSEYCPPTPPWARMMIATPSPSTPNPGGHQLFTTTKTPPQSPSLNGSSSYSKETGPTSKPSPTAPKRSMTGESPRTLPATKSSPSELTSYPAPRRASTLHSPQHEKNVTLSKTASHALMPPNSSKNTRPSPTCPTPMNTERTMSALPQELHRAPPELVDKLLSMWRVMTSALTTQAWPYHFCQELTPAIAHDRGPCMCFDRFS